MADAHDARPCFSKRATAFPSPADSPRGEASFADDVMPSWSSRSGLCGRSLRRPWRLCSFWLGPRMP